LQDDRSGPTPCGVVFENRRCTPHAEFASHALRLASALLARGLRREHIVVRAELPSLC